MWQWSCLRKAITGVYLLGDVTKHWNKLTREAVVPPSLKLFNFFDSEILGTGPSKIQAKYLRVLSKRFFNSDKLGAPGSTFWCLTTLSVKNLFLIPNLIFPWSSSMLPSTPCEEPQLPWGLPSASLLWAEQPRNFSRSTLIESWSHTKAWIGGDFKDHEAPIPLP